LALASTQRTKLEANVCERGSDWSALSASPPQGCIEHKVAKHLMTDADSAGGVYVLKNSSDIYTTIHVIVLQT